MNAFQVFEVRYVLERDRFFARSLSLALFKFYKGLNLFEICERS